LVNVFSATTATISNMRLSSIPAFRATSRSWSETTALANDVLCESDQGTLEGILAAAGAGFERIRCAQTSGFRAFGMGREAVLALVFLGDGQSEDFALTSREAAARQCFGQGEESIQGNGACAKVGKRFGSLPPLAFNWDRVAATFESTLSETTGAMPGIFFLQSLAALQHRSASESKYEMIRIVIWSIVEIPYSIVWID
jgi:hypothetical protein